MNNKNIFWLIVLGFLLLANPCWAQRPKVYEKLFFQPCEKFVTPHIKWLKPNYSGRTKVLFITYRPGVREVVELAQRMEMDYRVFAASRHNRFASPITGGSAFAGTTQAEEKARLKKLLSLDYDLIVMGNLNWDILPLDLRYLILKKVKGGTGLVGSIPARDEYINKVLEKGKASEKTASLRGDLMQLLRGFPCSDLAQFARHDGIDGLFKDLEIASFGKGRICLFKYSHGASLWRGAWHCLTPGLGRSLLKMYQIDYDYYLSLVIKVMVWAAGKKPFLIIEPGKPLFSFRRENLTNEKIEFTLSSRIVKDTLSRFVLRDRGGIEVYRKEGKTAITRGRNKVDFKVPYLPTGTYWADLWITDDKGKIINFSSTILKVDSSSYIKEVCLDRGSFRKKEKIRGRVKLINPSPRQKLRITQVDNLGRLVAKRTLPVKTAEVSFELAPSYPFTVLQHLDVKLISGDGKVQDIKKELFSFSDFTPPRDEIRVILWFQFPRTFLILPSLRRFYKLGVDTLYLHFEEGVSRSNLWSFGYGQRFVDEKTDYYGSPGRKKGDLSRSPCLTDPEYRDKVKKYLTKVARRATHYSVKEFSMGDECHFVSGSYDLCFSPTCKADFKKFVEREYGTINKLNREY